MDGGAWWATVHGVAQSWTQLSYFTFTFHFHALEKEMATHSSVLAWRIPGTGEPGRRPSMGSHRVGHEWSDLAAAVEKEFVFFFKLGRIDKNTLHQQGSYTAAAAAAKLLQLCPILCPIDGSPPGFPIPGILQARTLGWVAISFSNAWKGKVKVK